jgi:pimeloyl-ACP methyl ester carboxylesterase
MIFKTFGTIRNKKILLIHGMAMEGANYYHFEKLLPDYYLIIPTLDGHYAKNKTPFLSLDDQVEKILCYLNKNNINELYCVAGTSLGALIAFEIFKSKNIKVKKMIFDGGPFFNYNYFQKYIWEVICRSLFFVLKITNGDLMFPKSLINIKSSVVNYSKFVTRTDIKNIAQNIFNLVIPEPLNNKDTELVFLYGSKEHALKSMKRFKRTDEYRIIIKENLDHCQFLADFPKEYVKLINS